MAFDSPDLKEAWLRKENVANVLLMDWWPDIEMSEFKKERKNKEAPPPARDNQAVELPQVEEIASTRSQRMRPEIVSDVANILESKKESKWWNRPWSIAFGSAIIGTIVGFGISAIVLHRSEDLKTEITDEITRQLDERSTKDAETLKNRIATEVGKQLVPVNQTLQTLNQDIGKIKDHLHIAKATQGRLTEYAKLDDTKFSKDIRRITDTINAERKNSTLEPLDTVDAIQRKIAALPSGKDAVLATSAIIEYASLVREKLEYFPNAPLARKKTCPLIGGLSRIEVEGSTIQGCSLKIDNGNVWRNVAFKDAIIVWTGNAVRLENVTFVNCLFVFQSNIPVSSPMQKFANEILVKNVGPDPTFTASVG